MAFENLFGNIDFQAVNRAKMQQQQQLMQSVGAGVAAYEKKQDRELKRRQMEQKAQEREAEAASDYKQVAMDEINRIAMGGEKTQRGQAAIGVMIQTTEDQMVFDKFSQQMQTRPSKWASLGGGFVADQRRPQIQGGIVPPQAPTRMAMGMGDPRTTLDGMQVPPMGPGQMAALGAQGQGSNLAMTTPYDQIQPAASTMMQPTQQPTEFPQFPEVTGALAGTGRGEIMEQEASVGLQEYAAKKQYDSVFKGQELNKASINKQKSYETLLEDLLGGYEELIKEGGAIQTLDKDGGAVGIARNIAARTGASTVGQFVGGAMGTRAQAARDKINKTLPMMFGDLRSLMGMTGKELDTKAERDFYLNALTSPSVNVETNLETIESLSRRYGSGDVAKKVQSVRKLLGGEGGGPSLDEKSELETLRKQYGR